MSGSPLITEALGRWGALLGCQRGEPAAPRAYATEKGIFGVVAGNFFKEEEILAQLAGDALTARLDVEVSKELAVNGFGDDKAQDMREAVVEPLAPMRRRIRVAEDGPHPDLVITHLGEGGRHVVCPQIEGAATGEIEAGVVPVASQGAILDAAAIQGKAHVRAAIVEREDTTRQ